MTKLILKTDPSTKDVSIENNNLVLFDGNESLPQKIREKLLLFRGEYFLNETVGLPYFQLIAGQKSTPFASRKFIIDIIKSVEGIIDVTDFKMQLNNSTRVLTVDFTVKTEDGNININLGV